MVNPRTVTKSTPDRVGRKQADRTVTSTTPSWGSRAPRLIHSRVPSSPGSANQVHNDASGSEAASRHVGRRTASRSSASNRERPSKKTSAVWWSRFSPQNQSPQISTRNGFSSSKSASGRTELQTPELCGCHCEMTSEPRISTRSPGAAWNTTRRSADKPPHGGSTRSR